MTQPRNPIESVGDIFQRGLSLLNGGMDQVATVMSSADSSLRTLDGSLTGREAPPPRPMAQSVASAPVDLTTQAVELIRRGQQAAQETGNLSSPQVTQPFSQLMTLPFQPSLSLPSPNSLRDLMPSPAQAMQMGLQDLRGSMSLFRLANGTGTPQDLVNVAGYAETLVGRVQQFSGTVNQAVSRARAPAASTATADQASQQAKKPRRHRSRKKADAPDPASQALAQAVADEMGIRG